MIRYIGTLAEKTRCIIHVKYHTHFVYLNITAFIIRVHNGCVYFTRVAMMKMIIHCSFRFRQVESHAP